MTLKVTLLAFACFTLSIPVRTFAADGNAEKTRQLIATLQSPVAALQDKARACRQAGEFGTAALVPALAALLADEKLADYARGALENIPDPSAAAALRSALGKLEGDRLVGAINSLAVLRDAGAVGALQRIAADPARGAVGAALLALGRIATEGSIATLRTALRTGPAQFRADSAAACLLAAERQLALGKAEIAVSIYDDLRAVELPDALRTAAARGAIISRRNGALPLLLEQLRSADTALRDGALRAADELPGPSITAALIAELTRFQPAVQEQLIGVLVDRRDPAVLQPAELLARSSSVDVRIAAIKALATLGASSSVPPLLEAVARGSEAEAAAALLSLSQIRADGVDKVLLRTLPELSPPARAQMITVLGARRNLDAILAAFSAATNAAEKQLLIQILGLIGTPLACTTVQGALQDGDESVRDAAFRALVDWPDPSAMPWLLENLRSNSPPTRRAMLWRGAISTWRRTIRRPTREHTSGLAVGWFQELNEVVSTREEKSQLVIGLSELAAAHTSGLDLLRPYLDDSVVATEARLAVVQIGRRVAQGAARSPQPVLLVTLLERVAAGGDDTPSREEAAALAERIRGASAAASRVAPEF